MVLELFKQISNYTDKEGKERTATNFYLKCGEEMIPIEVRYFKDKQDNQKIDGNYRARKLVLSAFATELPKKQKNKKLPSSKICPNCNHEMGVDDVDGNDAIYFLCDACGLQITCYSDGKEDVCFPEA